MSEACPIELVDHDYAVIAIRADTATRGQAQDRFAQEHDYDFTGIRVRKAEYGPNPDYVAEQTEDGINEPYDGWPLFQGMSGAEYWIFEEAASND